MNKVEIRPGMENPFIQLPGKYLEAIKPVKDRPLASLLSKAIHIIISTHEENILGTKEVLDVLIKVFEPEQINYLQRYHHLYGLMGNPRMPKISPIEQQITNNEANGVKQSRRNRGYGPMQLLALVAFLDTAGGLTPSETRNPQKREEIFSENISRTKERLGDSPLTLLFDDQVDKDPHEDQEDEDANEGSITTIQWSDCEALYSFLRGIPLSVRLGESASVAYLTSRGILVDPNLPVQLIKVSELLAEIQGKPVALDGLDFATWQQSLGCLLTIHQQYSDKSVVQAIKALESLARNRRKRTRLITNS